MPIPRRSGGTTAARVESTRPSTLIVPASGAMNPAISRSSVVLPHPARQRGALAGHAAAPEPHGQYDRRGDDDHGDHGERGHRLQVSGLVEVVDRHRERDRAGAEEQDRGGQLLERRYEDEDPAREEPGSRERQRHAAERAKPAG